MKKKISPDKQRARALFRMAEISLERLDETDKLKYPSDTLKDYYNSIHQLMESILYLEGTKFYGEGAHFELINHIGKNSIISESEDYIKRNLEKIPRIIDKLRSELKIKLDK